MKFHYRIFNTILESDIKIEILDSCVIANETIQFQIKKNDSLSNRLHKFKETKNSYYNTNLRNSEIYIQDIALFNISNNGFSIDYILEKTSEMPSFFSKLLNHVIPYALYMQKRFVLHASGVTCNDFGVVFLGVSGAGKSSLAASLKEMSFMCEDSALIDNIDNELFLTPSFDLVKLSDEIYESLKFNYTKIANVKADKLNRNLYKVNNFLNKGVKLKRCYILEWGQSFKIEKIKNREIFGYLYSSVFGPHPLNSCKESEIFIYKKITEILNKIEFYKIYRNKNRLFSDNDSIINHIKN